MRSLSRRALLGASAAAGVSALSGCSIFNAPDARGAISSANPFGVPKLSTIEAFATSRFGVEPWKQASTAMLTKFSDAAFTFGVADDPAATLRPRFLSVPPDLVVNAGPDAMPMSPLLSQITDLTPFLSVVNYDGTAMRDVLIDGTITAGTANGVIATLNYVHVVYGLWYSDSLFGASGWTPPTSWGELQALGADTAKRGIGLLGTSADSVLDLQTLVIDSAI